MIIISVSRYFFYDLKRFDSSKQKKNVRQPLTIVFIHLWPYYVFCFFLLNCIFIFFSASLLHTKQLQHNIRDGRNQ